MTRRYVAWLAVALAACSSSDLVSSSVDDVDSALLHIDLQEGWTGEEIVVLVNSDEVFSGSITTRTQSGFAELIETETPIGAVSIRVEVAGGGLTGNFNLDLGAEWWVGVSVVDGQLRFKEQATLFGYV